MKGKGLLIALGKPKSGPSEEGSDKAKLKAAEALIAALKAEDASEVAEAFQLLSRACEYGSMPEDKED